ncbi:hypothetical protein MLD38_034355 [Melastoma candidum]|uniref:Uncharacterized protein n=1 Tax=Melastoma candidum TaxID=119954 RepID=A0ACB9M9N1_9MYRT|nr:hypothetical protein MLD38_034355 [Melastoma candidum]
MTWEAFASRVHSYQRHIMREPMDVRSGRDKFHENPSTCICEDSNAKAKKGMLTRKLGKGKNVPRKEEESIADDSNGGDDLEMTDPDDDGDEDNLMKDGKFNETLVEYEISKNEEPELEDMLSG